MEGPALGTEVEGLGVVSRFTSVRVRTTTVATWKLKVMLMVQSVAKIEMSLCVRKPSV